MHTPDHLLNDPVSLCAAAVSVGAVAIAVRRASGTWDRPLLARTAMTGALVFAVQMMNYPVAAGTSAHLIGAALATALLGPAIALLVVTSVLVVQATLFADGGITALGVNVLTMAVVGVVVATAVLHAGAHEHRRDLLAPPAEPFAQNWRRLALAGAAAAFAPVAVLCLLYAVGGADEPAASVFATRMLLAHLPAAAIEGVATAGLVAVLAAVARRRGQAGATVAGAGLAVVVAGGFSLVASSAPDVLENTLGTASSGVVMTRLVPALADYGAAGPGTAVAGVLGAAVVAMLLAAVLTVLRPRRTAPAGS